MGMSGGGSGGFSSEINVTPMVDIMLVLLIALVVSFGLGKLAIAGVIACYFVDPTGQRRP